ncbi:MAG: MarR family winged helix-turn-helix transcriptional regulator [Thermoleophilia bacterium]
MDPESAHERLDLVDALVQSSFLVQESMRGVARRHDVSIVQARLLGILRDREPGILALAEHLGLDKSSVTGLVDRAEARGLIERRPDPDDGRAIRVGLTADGRALAGTAEREVRAELQRLSAGLTEAQRDQLASLLGEVVSAGQAARLR